MKSALVNNQISFGGHTHKHGPQPWSAYRTSSCSDNAFVVGSPPLNVFSPNCELVPSDQALSKLNHALVPVSMMKTITSYV